MAVICWVVRLRLLNLSCRKLSSTKYLLSKISHLWSNCFLFSEFHHRRFKLSSRSISDLVYHNLLVLVVQLVWKYLGISKGIFILKYLGLLVLNIILLNSCLLVLNVILLNLSTVVEKLIFLELSRFVHLFVHGDLCISVFILILSNLSIFGLIFVSLNLSISLN